MPTADVSTAIRDLSPERPTTKEGVATHLRRVWVNSDPHQQIDSLASPEVVSSNVLGSRHDGVVDGLATTGSGNNPARCDDAGSTLCVIA